MSLTLSGQRSLRQTYGWEGAAVCISIRKGGGPRGYLASSLSTFHQTNYQILRALWKSIEVLTPTRMRWLYLSKPNSEQCLALDGSFSCHQEFEDYLVPHFPVGEGPGDPLRLPSLSFPKRPITLRWWWAAPHPPMMETGAELSAPDVIGNLLFYLELKSVHFNLISMNFSWNKSIINNNNPSSSLNKIQWLLPQRTPVVAKSIAHITSLASPDRQSKVWYKCVQEMTIYQYFDFDVFL